MKRSEEQGGAIGDDAKLEETGDAATHRILEDGVGNSVHSLVDLR